MIGAAKRYRELFSQLLLDRELVGGELPEEVESRYVEELDRCWWAMSSAEQAEAERAVAVESIEAPALLGFEDAEVQQGQHDPPRKAAA